MEAEDFCLICACCFVLDGDPALDSTRAMASAVRSKFLPNNVVLLNQNGPDGKRLEALSPFLAGMGPIYRKATAYVCEQYACKVPVTDAGDLEKLLNICPCWKKNACKGLKGEESCR